MSFQEKFARLRRNRNFKYGLPFLTLMVVGSFAMTNFTNMRYEYSRKETVTPDKMELYGIKMKKPEEVTLEKEYEKTMSSLDLDNWENKRGPRPWEENVQ